MCELLESKSSRIPTGFLIRAVSFVTWKSRFLGCERKQEFECLCPYLKAAQSKNTGRGRTVPSQSCLPSSLLHLDLLTPLQSSLALLKSLPSSNVLSLERKEDLLCPFHLCNRLHALSTNHRLQRKLLLQVFDLRVLSSNTLLELVGADYELLICDLESYVFSLEVGNMSGESFVADLI